MDALIATHDRDLLDFLGQRLERSGYRVTTAATYSQAAEALDRRQPSLVFYDGQLPGPGAVEFCRRVREGDNGVVAYVVVLLDQQTGRDPSAVLTAGADDWVSLPPNRQELEARLHMAHRRIQQQRRLIEAHQRLVRMCTHDSLTGLWNRRGILTVLREEFSRHLRQRLPLSVALFDLDRFKTVNDDHGHAAGDEVLVQAAARLSAAVRPYDSLGRYGGDEFLLVLPGCEGKQGVEIAERLRSAVARRQFATHDAAFEVTVSGGVAASPEMIAQAPEDLLRAADLALYEAKREGRNGVRAVLPMGKPPDESSEMLLIPIASPGLS